MAGFTPHRLLVIDDDELFLEIARFNLDKAGFEVDVASDPRVGLNKALETRFDLILLDLMMPGLRGEEVLSLLKPLNNQRILVVSGHTGDAHRSKARDLGAVAYLEKPVTAKGLCDTVTEILVESKKDPEDPIGGESPGFLDLPVWWVFGERQITVQIRIASWFVLLGLLGVLIWLFGF